MKNSISRTLQILSWIACVISVWLSLVCLFIFRDGIGWGSLILFFALFLYVPFCVLFLITPLAYLVYCDRERRDIRSLMVVGISTLILAIAAGFTQWLAPAGNGC